MKIKCQRCTRIKGLVVLCLSCAFLSCGGRGWQCSKPGANNRPGDGIEDNLIIQEVESIEERYLAETDLPAKNKLPRGAFHIDLTPTGKEAYERRVHTFVYQPGGKTYRIVFDVSSADLERQTAYWEHIMFMGHGELTGRKEREKTAADYETSKRKSDALIAKLQAAIAAGDTEKARKIGKEIDALPPVEKDHSAKEWFIKYRMLYRYSKPFFKRFAKGLNAMAVAEGFSRAQALGFVIQSVQAIRYEMPNQGCGLFVPAQVLTEQKGDCDSKSLLLYGTLQAMDYDMAFLYSVEYNHVLSGINTEASGAGIKLKGKKYYFIEAVTPNSPIGRLSGDWGDLSKWSATKF